MFSRRPLEHHNRGRIPGGSGPSTPASIFGSSLLSWWRPDAANVTIGTGVASLVDMSGNGHTMAQAVAANQPAWGATDGPNSTPAMTFDGVNDRLENGTIDMPAPATTNCYCATIIRQVTWTGNDGICGAFSVFGPAIRQGGTTPELQQYAGVAQGTNALALSTWGRVEMLNTGSTSDYIRALNAAEVTGTNTGNANGAGFALGWANAFFFSNIIMAEHILVMAAPSVAQRTALDAYFTARYGPGLV